MDFIKPTTINNARFLASTLPETDYAEWAVGTTYAIGDKVRLTTGGIHRTYKSKTGSNVGKYPPSYTTDWEDLGATNRWRAFDDTVGAQSGEVLEADLIDEAFADTDDWTLVETFSADVTIDPAGQLELMIDAADGGSARAGVYRNIGAPPEKFTIELKTYFTALDASTSANKVQLSFGTATWGFGAYFGSDGLFILKTGAASTEVGSNIVKVAGSAAWQTWRFEVDVSAGEADAVVYVFLDNAYQGKFDCDDQTTLGYPYCVALYASHGAATITEAHIEYIKVATGNGEIAGNRTAITHVLQPGAIDSVALLNLNSTTVEIVEIDDDDDLVTNGEEWTGATGTTPPTGWTDWDIATAFEIDGGALRITADGNNEGVYQTLAVTPGTEYQYLLKYKNTVGDVAQITVYDNTNSANILAATDLPASADFTPYSYVFTAPAGCLAIKVYIHAKSAGDIVWFDSVKLAPTEYSETVTTGASKTDVVKLDLPQRANGIITVTVNDTAGAAAVGEIVAGIKTTLGTLLYAPTVGITDYSTKEVDANGHYSIVARTFSKKMTAALFLLNAAVDEVVRLLSLYRSTPLVWVGDENYNALIVYGYYKDFQVVFSRPASCDCSLEVEGLT